LLQSIRADGLVRVRVACVGGSGKVQARRRSGLVKYMSWAGWRRGGLVEWWSVRDVGCTWKVWGKGAGPIQQAAQAGNKKLEEKKKEIGKIRGIKEKTKKKRETDAI